MSECKDYFCAYNGDKREQDSFLIAIAKYNSHEEISEAYELEFNGDVDDFLKRRWTKEKDRINSFIDKTIKKLEELC